MVEKKIRLEIFVNALIWIGLIFNSDILWFVIIMVAAPIAAKKAKPKPVKFIFWKEGLKTNINPMNEMKKREILVWLIFSFLKKIEENRIIIGYV